MPLRFNPPPEWPAPPVGWTPPEGWAPDPAWPPAPAGWQFWVEDPSAPQADPGAPTAGAPMTGAPTAGAPTAGAPMAGAPMAGAPMAGAAPVPAPVPLGPTPRQRSSLLPVLLIVAFVLIAFVVIGAAVGMASWAARSTKTLDLVTETKTANVQVDDSCGSITLRPGRSGVVTTHATLRYNWRTPSVTSQVSGDAVSVAVHCAGWFGSSVALVVEVPPGGMVRARSSAGSVSAQGLNSDLDLHSSAGSVNATEISSRRVVAESSAGSVSLSWAAQSNPVTIRATSSAGSVRVLIPDVGGVAYQVKASSSAGSTQVNVRTNPQSTQTITATSSAGSVLVGYN